MQASWTLQSKEQADEMRAIGDQIIIPYRNKLMPKSLSFEGVLVATVENDDWACLNFRLNKLTSEAKAKRYPAAHIF